jgi:ATP-binding cassette subfamily C (CFTR/MRP) protein 10
MLVKTFEAILMHTSWSFSGNCSLKMAVSDGFWLQWNWEDMCGPGGLTLWSVGTHDIGICFQELCLQVPVFILMATVSAYYCGRHTHWVARSQRQLQILGLRAIATVLMAVATVARICIAIALSPGFLQPVDYLLAVVEGVTWLVHLGFILALRHHLGVSLRGPFSVCVLWALNFALSAISVHSHVLLMHSIPAPDLLRFVYISCGFSIAEVVLQCLYMVTLFPSERSWDVGRYEGFDQHLHNSESQRLLGKM